MRLSPSACASSVAKEEDRGVVTGVDHVAQIHAEVSLEPSDVPDAPVEHLDDALPRHEPPQTARLFSVSRHEVPDRKGVDNEVPA